MILDVNEEYRVIVSPPEKDETTGRWKALVEIIKVNSFFAVDSFYVESQNYHEAIEEGLSEGERRSLNLSIGKPNEFTKIIGEAELLLNDFITIYLEKRSHLTKKQLLRKLHFYTYPVQAFFDETMIPVDIKALLDGIKGSKPRSHDQRLIIFNEKIKEFAENVDSKNLNNNFNSEQMRTIKRLFIRMTVISIFINNYKEKN